MEEAAAAAKPQAIPPLEAPLLVLVRQGEEMAVILQQVQKQELQILEVAVAVREPQQQVAQQAAQVTHESPIGHKERFYGTTLCFY